MDQPLISKSLITRYRPSRILRRQVLLDGTALGIVSALCLKDEEEHSQDP